MTGKAHHKPTQKQLQQALQQTASIARPTPFERALGRLARAEAALTHMLAAAALGDTQAPGLIEVARREVERARRALDALRRAAGDTPHEESERG